MIRKDFFDFHWDFAGFAASFLCALHCLATPFIFTFSTVGAAYIGHHWWVESSMLGLSAVLAVSVLWPSYIKVHHRLNALLMAGLGFVLIGLGLWVFEHLHPYGEVVFSSAGALSIAAAHVVNWRMSRQCTDKSCKVSH
ncbi:MerC domain-containing protein [Eisenibacter elegans]|uniref:MerC domain-containing protein n=1 Tax=Eisenibacter elegans TaxID=997 RepID=UPI000683EB5D|nr:MerC domain-containing protein [Eisenibacter elegans]